MEIRGSWVTLGKVSQTWQTLARTLPGARESLFRLLRIYSLGDELKEEIEAPPQSHRHPELDMRLSLSLEIRNTHLMPK